MACVIVSLVVLALAVYGLVELVRKLSGSSAAHGETNSTTARTGEISHQEPRPVVIAEDQAGHAFAPPKGLQGLLGNRYDVLWSRRPGSSQWAVRLVKRPEKDS
ncbi:MAG: hypothetical protein ACXVBG_21485 [Isosphaeraceae bacterium]